MEGENQHTQQLVDDLFERADRRVFDILHEIAKLACREVEPVQND